MTWGRRESMRQPKFVEGMEWKGTRCCGFRHLDLACVLAPGHGGHHDFRKIETGGK